MKAAKRSELEVRGRRVSSITAAFLGLSKEEETRVAFKLALAESLKQRRQKQNIMQQQLAKRLGSSQSRVAKLQAADRYTSMDLLVRSLLSLGASRRDIAAIMGAKSAVRKPAKPARKKPVKT